MVEQSDHDELNEKLKNLMSETSSNRFRKLYGQFKFLFFMMAGLWALREIVIAHYPMIARLISYVEGAVVAVGIIVHFLEKREPVR